jgi:hypothetical protein
VTPEERFQIVPFMRSSSRSKRGQWQDGFILEDNLTHRRERFDLKREAKQAAERILEREAKIDWSKIQAYDFRHSTTARPCTEVSACGEQGQHISAAGVYAMTLVGYDREEATVQNYVREWLKEMGHEDLPRKTELDAERERRANAAIFDTAAPGIRFRPSSLAAERRLVEA